MLTAADIHFLTPISWHRSGSLSDTRQGLAHWLLSESLSLFSFIFAKILPKSEAAGPDSRSLQQVHFLKLKFYRALAVRAICRHAKLHQCCWHPLPPALSAAAGIPRLRSAPPRSWGITSRNFCPCLPSPSPQHIHAGLVLWISCHVFYAARFMMTICATSLWWVHLSAQLTTGINHSLNTLVSAEPIKIL